MFQSTHPRGVRLSEVDQNRIVSAFQSTHPRGVRPLLSKSCKMIPKFQSTHPRGVRLHVVNCYITAFKFQSTHPRGVRLQQLPLCQPMPCFNPRTHEGCDSMSTESCANICFVSIHAPTRGATATVSAAYSYLKVSIHAPTRGATRFFYHKLNI